MDMQKKCLQSIVLFVVYVSLMMNASGSGFDDENVSFGEVKVINKAIKYHLLPGLYRSAHNTYSGILVSGYAFDDSGSGPPALDNFLNPSVNDKRDHYIFVKEFKVVGDALCGKNEINQKWYLIWKNKLFFKTAAGSEKDFKQASESFHQFIIANQTLNEKHQKLNSNYQKLNKEHQTLDKNYQTLKWYGMFSVGIFVLALVVMLVYTLVSEDSNIPKKFKAKDRVKVRNTNQQKWRIGEVVQALMVRVDGWEKAHSWNYVEKVEEDTERQDEETDDDIPTEDSLLCSSMSNTLEKTTTDEQNSESHHTMNSKTKAKERHTQSSECTEEHEEKSKSLSFTQENKAKDTNTQSSDFNSQKK